MKERTSPLWTAKAKTIAIGLATTQLIFAYYIGSNELLATTGTTLFRPIAITVFIPVVLFVLAYNLLPRFRTFVLAQDYGALTRLQLWRVIGFGFLLLYAHNVLPALFAWVAGAGDFLVGLTAFFVVNRLQQDADYASSREFSRFQYMGLADFAGALGTAGLTAGAFPALIPGGVTSYAMEIWPLNLFPSVIVPFFMIAHLTLLLKVRHERRANGTAEDVLLGTA